MADSTALKRQSKRLAHMSERGLKRATVLVHESNQASFDILRPHFANPKSATVLAEATSLVAEKLTAVNVSQVRQLSPFRYAGGKTWLIPEFRRWLQTLPAKPSILVEPFAGGAIASLTAAVENLADQIVICELDADVAAVWKVVFGRSNADASWLFDRIVTAELTEPFVRSIIEANPTSIKEKAFRTILKNRTQRGGILAPGAGLVKAGENGKGLLSRWYPQTLVQRMTLLREVRKRVKFIHGDAFEVIQQYSSDPTAAFFVDPPYSLGGKKAGTRLYLHNTIDHELLFKTMSQVEGNFLMTYDNADEVVDLAKKNKFIIGKLPMKNTHHEIVYELLIKKR